MPINLAGIQEKEGTSFEPLPEGVYYLRVTDGAEKDASGDKNAQHEFELTVQTGPYTGRKFKHWFALSEKMVPYLKHFYTVLGAKSYDNLSPTDYVSKPFMAELVIDEYNNKKNNKLQLGCYYEWDGKEETATGTKPESKGEKTLSSVSKPAAAVASKPAPKKGSPFSNAAESKKPDSDGEPPF
jgi:hypothetical protein